MNTKSHEDILTIMEAVADRWDVSPKLLISKNRTLRVLIPRQVAIYLIRELLETRVVVLGYVFDRDHSTILNSIARIEKLMETDEDLKHEVEVTRAKIKTVLAID
jgi:chromosomal replication initiator protein